MYGNTNAGEWKRSRQNRREEVVNIMPVVMPPPESETK